MTQINNLIFCHKCGLYRSPGRSASCPFCALLLKEDKVWCKLRERHMSDIAEAVAAEREACAALIEKASEYCGGHGEPPCQTPSELASMIRARAIND